MFDFRTDLANERRDIYQKANKLSEIDGIITQKKVIDKNISIEKVEIVNQKGEEAIGKKKGQYITMDIKNLKIADEEDMENAGKALAEELEAVINNHVKKEDEVLVVGLGNVYVTPDSLRT